MDIGKSLIFIGSITLVIGCIILFSDKFHWFGSLFGDFKYESKNMKIYAPLSSMLIISLVLSVIINIIIKIFK